MVATTLNGVMLTGDHASRPAANTVAKGALYACSTHGLIYQSDASSWSTWATLGTAASGSITASGYTQNTAKMLGRSTASSGAIEEITVGTNLTLSAGTLSASGGSFTQSYLGYNTVGATWTTVTAARYYCKKFTLSATSFVESIDVHFRPSTDSVGGVNWALVNDNSNAPGVLIAGGTNPVSSFYLSNSSSMPGAGRWVSFAVARTLAAADYWACVQPRLTNWDIANDGSGSDQTFDPGASNFIVTGAYPTAWAITTQTVKYSIRISIRA